MNTREGRKMKFWALLCAGYILVILSIGYAVSDGSEEPSKWDKAGQEVKEAAAAVKDATADSTQKGWEKTKEFSTETWDKTKEKSGEAADSAAEAVQKGWQIGSEKSAELWEQGKDKGGELWDKSKEGSAEAWEKTKQAASDLMDADCAEDRKRSEHADEPDSVDK